MVDVTADNVPDYVVNARWVLEGILLPVVGGLGVGGRYCFPPCLPQIINQNNISGNLITLLVIRRTDLDLKISFVQLFDGSAWWSLVRHWWTPESKQAKNDMSGALRVERES